MRNKNVLITQRIDYVMGRDEYRQSIDVKWIPTIQAVVPFPVNIYPLCNIKESINDAVDLIEPALIVLSGGNNIGSQHNRDEAEMSLLKRGRRG